MRSVAVVVVALLIVVLTTGASGETVGSVLRAQLAGQDVRLTMPTGGARPVGLALYFHGQDGDVDQRVDDPFLGSLRAQGWAIASSQFHDNAWGNADSTADTIRLQRWAEREAGVPATLWVSGSMGGATSLNAMLHGVEAPPCWYGVKPAIALDQMGTVRGANRYLLDAYGGPVPTERNPAENVALLPPDTRYRLVFSPEDTSVPSPINGARMVSELEQRDVDVSVQPASGRHMDPSHWNAADLVAFADGCRPPEDAEDG